MTALEVNKFKATPTQMCPQQRFPYSPKVAAGLTV